MLGPLQNSIRPDSRLHIKGHKKIGTPTHLLEILYSDTKGMLVLSSTVASHCNNCCTDGSTNFEN
jgi:hypothetical protein